MTARRLEPTFLRQILDLNPNFIFAKDREGRFTLVNQAVADAYGTTVEELTGRTDADFNAHAEEVGRFRRDDLEVMESLCERVIPEEPITRADGRRVWLQTIKRPIVGSDGRADQVLGVATDITDRRAAEEKLRQRTELLLKHQAALHELAMMETSDLGTALARITGAAARVLDVARAGVWLYNDDRTALICECLKQGTAPPEARSTCLEPRFHPRYLAALEAGRPIAARDARHDPRTDELAPDYLEPLGIVSVLDLPVRHEGRVLGAIRLEHVGTPREWVVEEQDFAGSIADLVSLALAAARGRELQEQLRQAQKMEAIGVLAGGIAHDFNNLLTGIRGYAELLLMRLAEEDPRRRHAAEIEKAAGRAAALTRQLLAFSRKQVLDPQVLDLNVTVAGLSDMLRRVIGEDIELHTVLDPALGAVRADPGQLEQVILNLVINARDAMPKGGRVTLKTGAVWLEGEAAQRRSLAPGPYVVLAVTDTGCGMPPDVVNRIFEPFFTTKDTGRGTGLGLSMVYGIVRQSDGHIQVESRPGAGSTFRVYLPRCERAGPDLAPRASFSVTDAGTGEVILLVEDEDLVRQLARDLLEARGYTVLEAANGAEALALCQRHAGSIHLMLTDIIMPRMSGRELHQRAAVLRPDMRVLFMSGYPHPTGGRALPETPHAFLEKPFTLDTLTRKVRQVLDSPQRGGVSLSA